MATKSTNLELNLTPNSAEGTTGFTDWRRKIDGDDESSNMQKIDKAIGEIKKNIPTKTSELVDDENVYLTKNAQTIAGIKTFTASPVVPKPTEDNQAASKGYVDTQKGSIFLPRLSVSTPVGVDITVTDGKTVLQKTSTETTTIFDVPNYGTWTASYSISDNLFFVSVVVDTVKIYPIMPSSVNFDDATWTDVVALANLRLVPNSWQIGDMKRIELKNGNSIDTQIIGKNRESIVGGGTASLVFGFADCYEIKRMNAESTNVGGWTDSEMRNYCNGDLLDQLPDELKNNIKKVTKKTSAGNKSTSIVTTEDYLWLLSATEVFPSPSSSYSPGGEGELFPIFTDNTSRIKNLDGSPQCWWLRSPRVFNDASFCCVLTSGTIYSSLATGTYGVVLGFAI